MSEAPLTPDEWNYRRAWRNVSAENDTLVETVERLAKLNEDKARHLDAYRKAASDDKARIAKLADALRELHGRLALCHGAIMGYGCIGGFHNPKCVTASLGERTATLPTPTKGTP